MKRLVATVVARSRRRRACPQRRNGRCRKTRRGCRYPAAPAAACSPSAAILSTSRAAVELESAEAPPRGPEEAARRDQGQREIDGRDHRADETVRHGAAGRRPGRRPRPHRRRPCRSAAALPMIPARRRRSSTSNPGACSTRRAQSPLTPSLKGQRVARRRRRTGGSGRGARPDRSRRRRSPARSPQSPRRPRLDGSTTRTSASPLEAGGEFIDGEHAEIRALVHGSAADAAAGLEVKGSAWRSTSTAACSYSTASGRSGTSSGRRCRAKPAALARG